MQRYLGAFVLAGVWLSCGVSAAAQDGLASITGTAIGAFEGIRCK